ncbi:MAG: GNAT family N-acetyltransferase [Gemmatimonadales bacterium]
MAHDGGWARGRGGAGVQLRRVLAFPGTDGARVAKGRQALVLNVYTEPPWRRRGIARALMQRIIEWARAEQVDGLVLHAAPDGRVLYEELGFVATNEMRYTGTLAPATPGSGPAG